MSTSTVSPVELCEINFIIRVVSRGVKITAVSVETTVRLTERATLLRAMKQMTLEAVPPGQQATRITPMM